MQPKVTVSNKYTTFKKVMGVNGKGEPVEQCFYNTVEISEPIVARVVSRQHKNAVVLIDDVYCVVEEGNWSDEF